MKNICLNWTISLLTGLFSLFLITTIGFIFHISINSYYSAFALLIFMIVLAKLIIKDNPKNIIKSILAQYIVLFDLLLFFGIICYFIPDFSYDGTTYHQAMIILLKNGLNPIWNNVSEFAYNQKYVFWSSIEYVDSFLKFFEIIGANIYHSFDKIELTKIINFILALSAFCYSFYTLRNFELSKIKCILLAFVLIYNPVCICQMLTNYVDGAFYYLFLILLLSCINYTKNIDINKSLYMICLSSVMLSNTKLTGLFTAVIIAIIFLTFYYSKKLLTTFLITAILIVISGINPYFTNIKQGKNVFYPVIKNSILKANRDGMITSYPKGFENKNRFEKLFISIFSVSKNISPLLKPDEKPELKIPFTIKGDDEFIYPDMRLAGFGYFFSGILLGTLILSIFIRFKNKKDKKLFFTVLSILILSIIGNHEAWWARFVPQFWIIPILITLFYTINTNSNKKHFIFTLFISTCIINSLIINIQNFKNSIINTKDFKEYVNTLPKVIYIQENYLQEIHTKQTLPVKLKEYGIETIYIK